MRTHAFFAASFGIALAQAQSLESNRVDAPISLHLEALRAMREGATDGFAASWPTRAPQPFDFNGSTFHLLPCASEVGTARSATAGAPPRACGRTEPDRLLRVYPRGVRLGPLTPQGR